MAFVGAASFENVGKARALCMGRVLLSTAFFATTTLSVTLSTADDFTGAPLIRRLAPHYRRFGPRRASPVPTSTFRPFHSLYPGGSFGAAVPGSSRLLRPSPSHTRLGTRSSPEGAWFTRRQDSRNAADRPVAPSNEAFDTALRRQAFPPDAGSLLPGSLAITRTGLPPAGGCKLATTRSPSDPHHLLF